MKIPLLLVAFCQFARIAHAQTFNVDSLVKGKLQELHIPGLAASKVENGKISWKGYYGYQDVERKIPVTDSTIFHIASISKTITAAAVMQLEANGYFELDDEINRFLPFRVGNPLFPAAPITFRHLLWHRSSIVDNMDYLLPFWENKYQGPISHWKHFFESTYQPVASIIIQARILSITSLVAGSFIPIWVLPC